MKEVKIFSAYQKPSKIPKLGCIIYTDGKIINESIDKEIVNGFAINDKLFNENIDTVVTETINLKRASYVIYIYYKDNVNNYLSCLGWYQEIVDVCVDVLDHNNEKIINEVLKTLEFIKQKQFIRELMISKNENNNSKVYTIGKKRKRK